MTESKMGRPKQLDQAHRVTITLDAQDVEYLRTINSNTSAAVREIIHFHLHEHYSEDDNE